MNTDREIAYRVDPALWMHDVLGITPHDVAGDSFCAHHAGHPLLS